MRTLPRLAPLLLLAPALLLALESPAADRALVDPSQAEDVQDLLYLAPGRPVLFRLHLSVDGKPYAEAWSAWVRRLFAFLDRDDDGFLDKDEVLRVPRPERLAQMFDGNLNQSFTGLSSSLMEDLDANQDGKVSPEELLAYYRKTAGPVLVAPAMNNGASADVLSDVLFAALDKNKDGLLSREEVAAAPEVLRVFDLDDDEVISVAELTPGTQPARVRRPVAAMPRQAANPTPLAPLLLILKEEPTRRVAQRLSAAKEIVNRYDTDRDQKLSRAEIGLPKELFDRLDANKDDKLDALELLRWLIARPDAEAVLRLRPEGTTKEPAAESVPPGGSALRRTAPDAVSLSLDDTQINIVCPPVPLAGRGTNAANARNFYQQQFAALDIENRGYVNRKQAEGPQGANLRYAYEMADRDEDGKLTRKELEAFTDLVASASGVRLVVTLTGAGRGLFQILDADHNGVLGVRELRTAWDRLAPYDRDGDGRVSRKEIPDQYYLVVSVGTPNYAYGQPAGFRNQPRAPRGPLWFRKMDRNGDGDVSIREFLGPPAAFRQLDLDGDGLISVEEAERAEALRRPPGR